MPEPKGFFTDTTVCIGCKACQVACHQWNDLPAGHGRSRSELPVLSGNSYDNTGSFSDVNWRHVKFIEQPLTQGPNRVAWLMMSDVCKHCVNAPCLEVCPTGAILRTEFDSVFISEPACNGCRDCVSACPFGVIHMSESRGVAQKCTLCYDRLKNEMVPACAQACPTNSIQFDTIANLKRRAEQRVSQLHREGVRAAHLYGADDKVLGGLNSFYLLVDKPEVYGLPSNPKVPSRSVVQSSFWGIMTAIMTGLGMLFAFRSRTTRSPLDRAETQKPAAGAKERPIT
ncbi:MAG: 4Fe-4S dicluster domain-containing protein [Planctomycetes bacterium]|nr:4Fe-4S dicluster domain-containing protein [Planctomycetota bacterium]